MTWILTQSGKHFDFTDPRPEQIEIMDIAHALSHECRYAGHVRSFYSVAQHCVLASRIVPPAFALEALLHDASEAYCKDIPSPLKALLPEQISPVDSRTAYKAFMARWIELVGLVEVAA